MNHVGTRSFLTALFACNASQNIALEFYRIHRSIGNDRDGSRSYISVRLDSRDEQSHQVGRDINLQCAVQGSVERPYEYTFTKDGQPLEYSETC